MNPIGGSLSRAAWFPHKSQGAVYVLRRSSQQFPELRCKRCHIKGHISPQKVIAEFEDGRRIEVNRSLLKRVDRP